VVYRALADLLVVAHLSFVVFVLFGGLLALRRWSLALLHLPAAVWGTFIEVSGGFCPLTPLEQELRHLSGAAGYSGGFIEHYLLPVIYPSGLTREVQLAFALLVVLVNLVVYGLVAHRLRGQKRRLAAQQGSSRRGTPR
jgi:hypothetical protein